MKIDLDIVKELIDSDVSAYQIEKDLKISRMMISNYRNDPKKLLKMSVENAIKLQEYQIKRRMINMTVEQLQNYIREFKGTGTTVDSVTGLFNSDVQSMKKALEKDELYIYTVEDYIEDCLQEDLEWYEKEEDEEGVEEQTKKIEDLRSENATFVIDEVGKEIITVK